MTVDEDKPSFDGTSKKFEPVANTTPWSACLASRYTIDPLQRRIIVTSGTGCNFESSIASIRSLAADSAFMSDYAILADFRGLGYAPTAEEAQKFGELLPGLGIRGAIAFLVSDELHFGIAQMLGAFAGMNGITAAAFRNIAEAEAWLSTRK